MSEGAVIHVAATWSELSCGAGGDVGNHRSEATGAKYCTCLHIFYSGHHGKERNTSIMTRDYLTSMPAIVAAGV